MKRDGKNAGAFLATIMCLTFICGMTLPLLAQAADTTPPVTNASVSGTVGNNGWYTTTPTVSLSATDAGGSGVAHTYYRINGSQLITYTTSFTLPDGSNSLLFYSVDNAGNTEPTISGHNSIVINVDTEKPTMNITIKGSIINGYYNGTATLNLTARDNVSGISSISYSYDNTNWNSYTGNVTLKDGSYTLYYGCYDNAGNAYNNSTTLQVFNPEIDFNPTCNKWYTDVSSFNIYFILPPSGDVDHVDFAFNDPKSTWHHSNDSTVYPIYHSAQGNTTIYYRAVSASGLMGNMKSVWYGIDTVAPTIGVSFDGEYSKSKGWFSSDITVHLNVNDPGPVTTEYSWDNSHWSTYSGPFKVSKGSSRTIYFRTTDLGGRSASGSQFIYFAPTTMNQGAMSDSVWINGVTYSGNPTATTSPTTAPTAMPTSMPIPTPVLQPSPTATPDVSTGSGDPLAIAILIGVLAFLGIAAAAVYLFVFKPK
ncbi:MAG TPA: hypothetical protein VMC84_04610 [Methanocella sp.]|uniref:OmpL47-type beta-barrel domain-containing protein n=1 Tax=Methanocella sp. TaxID=2052833 RepID=UPI002CA5B267|nr:hypothetical protein [Methanocella sp.]HTY90438.1 hypothetical protein [Methanocella sp.]